LRWSAFAAEPVMRSVEVDSSASCGIDDSLDLEALRR
jgi:hypothetical protein